MVDVEVSPWLKGLPVAPEYHPVEAEFVDPISFVLRIEEEARKFGICKIVPPTGKLSRKALLSNIHRSIATAQARSSGKQAPIAEDAISPARSKFSTRRQELGDQSSHSKGASYTLDQFEAKAKAFARGVLGTCKDVAPLSVEALFWRMIGENKPVSVEYAENIPGSAFPENASEQADGKKRKKVADKEASTGWNMQQFSKLPGSLLRFMQDEVPGVTSPLIYMSMLFSSCGWNTNHHDLHSVDYLHMGAPKTLYAVPPEAAPAFEDVVRNQEMNSFLSPEVLVFNGVPCCRLVQNPGEFVIIFPRAYSINLHHGFGCGETCSLATPGWLKAAKQAAARKILLDRPPMVCHEQLLYQAAFAFAGSSSTSEIRSSRLKHKKKPGVEEALKTEFVQDIMKNQLVVDKLVRLTRAKCVMFKATENLDNLVNLDTIDSFSLLSFVCASMEGSESKVGDGRSLGDNGQVPQINWGNVSCAVCGILCYSCIAIVKPTAEASHHVLEEKLAISGNEDLDALLPPCIVCPDHGLQVCSQLQLWGGSQVLVIYHPEYESFDRNAKHFAEEMSLESQFKETTCEVENDDDRQLISSATEMAGKPESSWIARVHSSCPSTALSLTENNNDDLDEEDDRTVEKFLKEKKCWVVGRWCGRVWRCDQTHAALGGSKTVSKMVREGDGVDSAETDKTIDTSKKRKEHEEETTVNCASLRKNCRKKRRTQMAAVWRVESEPQPDSGELTSVNESFCRKAEDVTVKEPVDVTRKAESLELQMEKRSSEEPASRTPSFAGKEGVDSNEKSAVLEASYPENVVENKPPVCDDLPRHSATFNESSPREDVAVVSKLILAEDGIEHESKNRGSGPLLTQKDKLSVVVVSQDELGGERNGTHSGSTPCFSNSVWHDVPIAFSPNFHSSYMDEKPKVWPTAYRTPILAEIPRKKRTHTLPSAEKKNHEVSGGDSEMEADPSESDASYSNDERPADETAESVLGRTRRTKRKSWKALAAEDEQLEKAAKKGSKKSPTPAKKPSADSKRKFAPGMVESSGSHACDFDGCTMSFRTASELSLHKRNICTIKDCAKRLCSHSYLMQHYRVHVDERPLKCPWKGCKKTFKWSWARTEHIRVHTGERPYSCGECGKSYRFVSDFSRHKRTTGHNT